VSSVYSKPGDPPYLDNPWGLTRRQVEAAHAVIECGSSKAAARVLGISQCTVNIHLEVVRGAVRDAHKRTRWMVLFDRWARALEPGTLELPANG
jgi:FixJ family two-component response regulator